MRGQGNFPLKSVREFGITPADAGTRAPSLWRPHGAEDHPRGCGDKAYNDGWIGSKWLGEIRLSGDYHIYPNKEDWQHLKHTFSFNMDKGQATNLNIYPAYLRDIDADLYIRNIMVTYEDEDYPYTPAPEIDETVVLE